MLVRRLSNAGQSIETGVSVYSAGEVQQRVPISAVEVARHGSFHCVGISDGFTRYQPPRATAVVRYAEGDVGVGDHRPAPGVLQVDAPCEVPSGAEVGSPDDGPHVIRQTGEGCLAYRCWP